MHDTRRAHFDGTVWYRGSVQQPLGLRVGGRRVRRFAFFNRGNHECRVGITSSRSNPYGMTDEIHFSVAL